MQTIISLREANNAVIIEAKNKVTSVSIAEKNSNLIYRIFKAAFLLKLKTIRTLFNKWLNG